MEKKLNKVPAAQSLQYIVQRVLAAIMWLKEVEQSKSTLRASGVDGAVSQIRSRILADIISVYVSTLVEKNGSGHSLLKSYSSNDFVRQFKKMDIVKKCQRNRHNRCAHEARSYGNFVYPKEILDSKLENYLNDIQIFLAITREK